MSVCHVYYTTTVIFMIICSKSFNGIFYLWLDLSNRFYYYYFCSQSVLLLILILFYNLVFSLVLCVLF